MIRYIVFVGLLAVAIIANPVSFITKCKPEDGKCLKESTKVAIPFFTEGLPDLGVGKLDPVFFQKIDLSTPTLKLVLDNITVKGLKNCIPKKVQRDDSKSSMFMRLQCNATLDGHYVMSGRLLILPIEGNGKSHVDLNNAIIDLNLNMSNEQGKDGKNHWNIKNWSHTYDLKGRSNVRFENLFNGNKVLASAAEAVIASSGNDIIREVGSPVIKTVTAKVVEDIGHFFQAVPIDDLSL